RGAPASDGDDGFTSDVKRRRGAIQTTFGAQKDPRALSRRLRVAGRDTPQTPARQYEPNPPPPRRRPLGKGRDSGTGPRVSEPVRTLRKSYGPDGEDHASFQVEPSSPPTPRAELDALVTRYAARSSRLRAPPSRSRSSQPLRSLSAATRRL